MAGASTSRRIRPGVAASHPTAMLVAGLVVSALAHVWVAMAALHQPIGYVDPALLRDDASPLRIKRATYDYFVDADAGASGEPAPDIDDAPDDAPPDTAETLSRELLETLAPPPPVSDAPRPEAEEPRPDERATIDADALAAELAPFAIESELLVAAGGSPRGLTIDVPQDPPSPDDGAGLGSLAAGALRSAATPRTTSPRPAARPLSRETRDDAPADTPDAAPLDRRALDLPLDGPSIDFAAVALAGTTRLDVPERLDDDFDYVVHRYDGDDGGYFRVDIIPKRSLRKLQTMPKDLVFVIDTSESVPQAWVQQVIRGVQQAVRMLNDGDRFNIVLFNENPRFFSTTGPQPANPASVDRAVAFLAGARSQGYTDVNAALSQLLVRDVQTQRVYEIIMISDGRPTRGVLDTRELLNLITRDNDLAASIYCVGITPQMNRELLNFLAYRNKGFSLFVRDIADVATTIRDLASRLRYPLIKDLRLNLAGGSVREVYPADLPNIHQNERFALFGRFDHPAPFTLGVTGTSAGQPVDFTFTLDLNDAGRGDDSIARDWAFWKLHHLYNRVLREGDGTALRRQIDALRKRYNLKTVY